MHTTRRHCKHNLVRLALMLVLMHSALALSPCVRAQSLPPACYSALASAAQGLPNAYVARSQFYCDGAVPVQHRGQVELVSYTTTPIQFGRAQSALQVRSAVQVDSPVRVIGVDKRMGQNYRLDGMLSPAGLVVDLRAAILPLDIPPEALGLFGWSDVAGTRQFVPLSTGEAAVALSGATLAFRTPVALVQVTGEVCTSANKCEQPRLLSSNLRAGRAFEMPLTSNGTPHIVTVNIVTTAPGNQVNTNTYIAWLP